MSSHCDTTPPPNAGTNNPRICLIGNPNCGKTSLFNRLTGMRGKVGNYPGVTVTRRGGTITLDGTAYDVEDLPGTYSLAPMSPDEQVVVDALEGRLIGQPPSALLVVADATNLRRSLRLLVDVLRAGVPTMLVLTMADELALGQGSLDAAALERAIGIPVTSVQAARGLGIDNLRDRLRDNASWTPPTLLPDADPAAVDAWVDSVLAAANYTGAHPNKRTRTLDNWLLHPIVGVATFFAVMFIFFQMIFTVATPMADALEGWITALSEWVGPLISNPLLSSFVTDGILAGVGGVVVFVPQIALLFLLLAVLEGSGYLSRAAFLMDKVMASSGLDGRAFVSMLSSVACAVPGIMSTRTMPSARDRLATMLSAPLMTCSARLPVYVLLIGLLVDSDARIGPFAAQGAAMFALYVLGGLTTLIVAWVIRKLILRTSNMPFYLEMPPYRVPSAKDAFIETWSAVSAFLKRAGTIILIATAVLWALLTFPRQDAAIADLDERAGKQYVLEHSYAATVGKALVPVFEPLGFDWRINVGLVGATAAREVFVSTLGQVVAAEDPENPSDALAELTHTTGQRAGNKVFDTPTTVALLVWFAFAMQCISTLAVMRRESGSWKWPAVAVAYMGVLAYTGALLARWTTAWVTG